MSSIGKAGPVRQFGYRVRQHLEDRDARVVGVVVGPGGAASLLDVADSLASQAIEILCRRPVGWR